MKELNNNTNSSNSTKSENSTNSCKDKTASRYNNVEPLPESFRPRKDGPGGE